MRPAIPPLPPTASPSLHGFEPGGSLAAWLRQVALGAPRQLGPLEICPLIRPVDTGEPYLLLREALDSRALTIEECEGGVVNEVLALNPGKRVILILEGESIRGAKQNRVVTRDTLVAPGMTAPLPVGCVESGRWSRPDMPFVAGVPTLEPSIRAGNVAAMSRTGAIDQGRLWRHVSEKLLRSKVESPTQDYHAYAAVRYAKCEERARSLELALGQVGILVLCDGQLRGLELLGHPDNWAAIAPRVASAYIMDADDERPAVPGPGRSREEWLASIAGARVVPRTIPGLGTQFALEDPRLVGGGLWHDGRPAHFSVFPNQRPERGSWVAHNA